MTKSFKIGETVIDDSDEVGEIVGKYKQRGMFTTAKTIVYNVKYLSGYIRMSTNPKFLYHTKHGKKIKEKNKYWECQGCWHTWFGQRVECPKCGKDKSWVVLDRNWVTGKLKQ